RKGFRFVGTVTRRGLAEEVGSEHFSQSLTAIGDRPGVASSRQRILLILVGVVLLGAVGYSLLVSKTVAPPVKTIAVLPFKPLNADSRNESLEMGMTETLITHLSNLRQIIVRPISSVRKYVDLQQDPIKAGQELQTDAVLDGSIQKVGDRVRVTVR